MKKYIKGKREHISWDKKSKQIRILKKAKIPAGKKLGVEVNDHMRAKAIYADEFLIHFNENEFIVDALKTTSPNNRKIVSRIILSPKTAKRLVEVRVG